MEWHQLGNKSFISEKHHKKQKIRRNDNEYEILVVISSNFSLLVMFFVKVLKRRNQLALEFN